MTKKKLIKFNQDAYNQQKVKYQKYVEAIDEAISFIKTETGISMTPKDLKEGRAWESLQRKFKTKHEGENALNLSATKLMDLMEVNFTGIIKRLDTLKALPIKDEPNKEKFGIYATTPKQIERLNIVKTILQCYDKLDIKSPSDLKIQQPLNWNGKFNINQSYIKKG